MRRQRINGLKKVYQSLDDDYTKVSSIPKSYVRKPKGLEESKIAPVNMPNQGRYPGS